ncbi:MAG: UPF0262 family protein [Bdellovibrionales bacterium]
MPGSCIASITITDLELNETQELIRRDRMIALRDLKTESHFLPRGHSQKPYTIALSVEENRLVFRITDAQGATLPMLVLSLKPYRRLIKDYFMIVRSYDEAIRIGKPSRIEAIDMGRRGLHNEGAELLKDRLSDKIDMDLSTARRLFTLICVLHAQTMAIWR